MSKNIKEFMAQNTQSTAKIINDKIVEVTALDGELFQVFTRVGMYKCETTRNVTLHSLELIFDQNYSEDKEQMTAAIWRDAKLSGINILGISSGNRHGDRVRIGARIRQIREERNIEARDLAKLAGIDAANLSRIENGKYSVGLDILSKIAFTLGTKIDLVEL